MRGTATSHVCCDLLPVKHDAAPSWDFKEEGPPCTSSLGKTSPLGQAMLSGQALPALPAPPVLKGGAGQSARSGLPHSVWRQWLWSTSDLRQAIRSVSTRAGAVDRMGMAAYGRTLTDGSLSTTGGCGAIIRVCRGNLIGGPINWILCSTSWCGEEQMGDVEWRDHQPLPVLEYWRAYGAGLIATAPLVINHALRFLSLELAVTGLQRLAVKANIWW